MAKTRASRLGAGVRFFPAPIPASPALVTQVGYFPASQVGTLDGVPALPGHRPSRPGLCGRFGLEPRDGGAVQLILKRINEPVRVSESCLEEGPWPHQP